MASNYPPVRWRLHERMAGAGIRFAGDLHTRLVDVMGAAAPSADHVRRLVSTTPIRLNLHTLAGLCAVLHCAPADLIDLDHSQRKKDTVEGLALERIMGLVGTTLGEIFVAREVTEYLVPSGHGILASELEIADITIAPDSEPLSFEVYDTSVTLEMGVVRASATIEVAGDVPAAGAISLEQEGRGARSAVIDGHSARFVWAAKDVVVEVEAQRDGEELELVEVRIGPPDYELNPHPGPGC